MEIEVQTAGGGEGWIHQAKRKEKFQGQGFLEQVQPWAEAEVRQLWCGETGFLW